MSFVSYAQNFEDVMLWRALKHVARGFYIDIGAAWPNEHSVTKVFYEHGWRGINVEPNPEFHVQLQLQRPRDLNLRLAVSDREGNLTMNFLVDTGLSTLDDAIADKHQQAGWDLKRQEVHVTTLANLWNQHVTAGQEVHFLKVDVEGQEEAVLRGNDWDKNRPWIVVVEATLPMSQVESHGDWEPILRKAKYQFAYADGLNRFYLADEHLDLLPVFKYPPNVFDAFVLSTQQRAETRATEAETRATEAETRATEAETRATEAEARATEAEARMTELLNSTSWRITAPMRWVASTMQDLSLKTLKHRLKLLLQHAVLYIGRRPWLKNMVLRILGRFPGLKSRIFRLITGIRTLPVQSRSMPTDVAHLAPHAREIHADLKTAIERHQRKNG